MTNETDQATTVPARRVTSADVAKASGVSRATVSYVLNDVPGRAISEATRALVLRTASELGHVPFAPARSLRLGRSDIVLALVRDFAIGFVSNRLLKRLDVALAERGYVMLVHRFDDSLRSMSELWGLVSPALVVAMGGLAVTDEAASHFSSTKLMRVHGIVPHAKAGEMQAQYLYDRGHRVLGYAFPSTASLELIASERLAGVRRACERLGLEPPVVCNVDPDNPETVFDALDAWAAAPEKVTAVASHNDEIAIMLTAGLAARGLTAGKDLAVIGVDNIPSARINLTTVEIDIDAWGDAIVDNVLALLDNKEPEPIATDFLRLIVRDTA